MTDIHGLKPNVRPSAPYNVTAQIRGDIRQIVQQEIEQIAIGTIGAETPAGAQAKVDASALSLTAAIAAAKAELQLADDTKAALVHTHDDLYYLKAQVDAGLAGKAALVHNHNTLYYTTTEVDALIAGVSGGAGWTPVAATTTTQGIVELATTAETTTGLDGTRATTPAGVKAALDAKAASDMSTYAPIPTGTPDGTKFYKDDGTWAVPAGGGTGDVTGPAGAVAGNLAALDITGKVLSDSGFKPSDFASALGAGDNYVTDAEKAALHSHSNKTALDAVSGVNTGDQDLSGYALSTQAINAQTGTTYTLVASDASKLVTCTNSGAITVTVPASTFAAGQRVDLLVLGAGMVTVAAGSGMTLNGTPSLVSRAQYSALTVLFLSATTAVVVGDLATP